MEKISKKEKTKSKKIKKYIILLITILLIFCGTFIFYNYSIDNYNYEQSVNLDAQEKNSEENISNTVITSINENIYWLLNYNDEYYLIKKDNENYKVIYYLGSKSQIKSIGLYKNNYYYEEINDNTVQLKFINLDNDKLISDVWIDIPQYECSGSCVVNGVDKTAIIDDILYFSEGYFSAGGSKEDGLLMLNMNASSFNEYKVISSLVDLDEWFVDKNNKKIYYMNFYREDNSVYQYDTTNSKSTFLFNTSGYSDKIDYINNNVVYYDGSNGNLSLYNLTNHNFNTLTSNLKKNNYSYKWYSIDNYLYYYDGNRNIIQYDVVEENSKIYYSVTDLPKYIGFTMYDNNSLEVYYQDINSSKSELIYNQELINNFPDISIQMLDGSFNNFSIKDLEVIN